jgi:hypothetical protein
LGQSRRATHPPTTKPEQPERLYELRGLILRVGRIVQGQQGSRCEDGREFIAWPAVEVASDPRLHDGPAEVADDATKSLASPVECGKSAEVSFSPVSRHWPMMPPEG